MTRSASPTLRRSLFAVAATLFTLLAFAACGASTGPATQTQSTPLPDAATILQKAEAVTYKDVTFTIALAVTSNGQTINATGTGQATKSPERTDITVTTPVTISGKSYQKVVEQITDKATNALYTKTTGIPGASGKWVKSSLSKATGSNSPVDVSGISNLTSYKSATMIGADTVDGVAVWHLQNTQANGTTGTPAATGTATAANSTADIFIRQDNNFPAKVTVHETGGTNPLDMTLDFTKYDSGLTIAIPKV